MDPFDSETVSSGLSEPQDSAITYSKKKVQTRKLRRTVDLIALDLSEDSQEDSKPTIKLKREKMTFLPKIELTENVERPTMSKTTKFKQNRPSLAKKEAVFKIGRAMIEGKQFQGKLNTSKSKFPKIRLKLNEKKKRKPVRPNEAVKIQSNASRSSTKVKSPNRKSKAPSRKSGQGNNNEDLQVVLKDLVVNLIPLEKTNLVNADQIAKLTCPLKRMENSYNKKNVLYHENIVPCKVVLERLSLEEIQLLTSKQRVTSLVEKPSEGNIKNTFTNPTVRLEIISDSDLLINSKDKSKKSRLSDSRDKSIGNCEDFNPGGSSSPLQKSIIINEVHDTTSLSPTKKTRLTYELDENETKFMHSTNVGDAELEKENVTYEIEAGPSTRKSSLNRKGFEELPRLSVYNSNTEPSTSTNKPLRKSRRFNNNETYELNKNKNDVLEQNPISDKDATFEINVSKHPKTKSRQSTQHSKSFESVLIKSNNVLTVKRRQSCNSQIDAGKKRRSNSYDPDVCISVENKLASEKQPNESATNIPRKRRSTLTLEDSINDISLLQSICDTSGVPKILNKSKRKSKGLIKQALKRKSVSDNLEYSNITLRKQWSPCSESVGGLLNLGNSNESTIDLGNTSPPWSNESNSTSGRFEINGNDESHSSEEEQIQDADAPSTSSTTTESLQSHNVNNLLTYGKRTSGNEIIDISDEDESENGTSLASSDSDSDEIHLPIQQRRVTFELDLVKQRKQKLHALSSARMSSPKSAIKNNSNKKHAEKNHRVTFNDMSVIFVDDTIVADGSSERKSNVNHVPTNFPSDDESSEESPKFNKRGTVGRTPSQKRKESSKFKIDTKAGCSTPLVSKHAIRTPIKVPNRIESPKFNKRGSISRTPLNFKAPVEDNNIYSTPSKLNDRISSGERVRLQNGSLASPVISKSNLKSTSKRTKMPDFARLHKKMFDKMLNIEEYSKHKEERAKLLLSGNKSAKSNSSLKKLATKQVANTSHNKVIPKKQLKYEEPSSSQEVRNKAPKKAVLVSSTPRYKKNEHTGFTRYGFKIVDDQSITKKEQFMAVANKMRLPKSNTASKRTEIKGVRSNRRFDLLMKMRNKT